MCAHRCGGQRSVCGNRFSAPRREGAQVIRPESKYLYVLTHTSSGVLAFVSFLDWAIVSQLNARHIIRVFKSLVAMTTINRSH